MNDKRTLPRLLAALFLLFPLLAGGVEIVKSPNDHRQYQYLELPNRLRVVLVSDPEADKAAAALTVGVGSNSNPPGRDGLAHFLEHMLFMGTEKYPQVDGYSDFIKKNGGMDNAFTAGNQTTYFFDIKPEALESALDRFAQFFIAPLMDARYVEREKHAVHSEYQLKLKDDDRRIAAAQRQSYNPASPWSRFAVGNLQTLADRPGHPVRDDLLKFYREHYSANLMGLAVVGRQPLPVLRRWVEEKFSAVPDRDKRRWAATPRQRLYLPGQLPVQVSAVPLKRLHKMELSFLLPSVRHWYREEPLYYIANFVGDEGEGSLHDRLRRRGWLDSLTASGQELDDGESIFNVEMELTAEGMKHVREIVDAFFAYADLLRREGVESWRYQELKRLQALDFRFQEKEAPADYAVELSSRLLDYPPADLLTAGKLFERFDPELIERMLAGLIPQNLSLTLVDQDLPTNKVEKWYQVPYAIGTPPSSSGAGRARWLSELALPKPNPFLPEHVALKPAADASPVPKRLVEARGLDLWFQQDESFGVPRGAFAASFELPAARDSARHAVALQLFTDLVNDRLNAWAYPAQEAGLGYSLEPTQRGLLLLIHGYDDKQPVLLDKVLDALATPDFPEERFRVLKAKLERDLANEALDRPFRQVLHALDRALVKPSWSPRQKLEALKPLTREELRRYGEGLFRRAEVRVLAHGNFTAEEARAMEARLRARLLAKSELAPVPDPRVRLLEPGETVRIRYPVDHPDSVVALYFQGADRSLAEQARWRLLAQILQNPFYSALRTEQQLGYVVAAVPWERQKMPGLLFLVQSSAVPAAEVEKRIERFVAGIESRLAKMDDATFATFQAGLASKLRKRDQNLLERTMRYLDDLVREQYGFDHRKRLADAVEKLDREALTAFARDRLRERPRRMVAFSPGTRFAHQAPGSSRIPSKADKG